jgi:hypothetical protein
MIVTPVGRDEAKAVYNDAVSVIERDETMALLAEQARVQAEAGGPANSGRDVIAAPRWLQRSRPASFPSSAGPTTRPFS